MRTLLVFLIFCVYALGIRWYFVCQMRNLCENEPAETADTRLPTLKLTEGDSVIFSGFDQFAFDTAAITPQLNDNNRLFLDTLVDYFRRFPEKKLTLTAFYRAGEAALKPGFYENIGIARAGAVRKELMTRGLAENRISIDHGLSEDSLLREPVLFAAYASSGQPDEFEKVQFTFENMTFMESCFAFDSDLFTPAEPFVLYADSVKTYLELHPEKSLTIVGHTDNVGTPDYNLSLGKRRAESAREYFRELGVTKDIRVDSKGETAPVAPNMHRQGRQKNRRVNIIIE